MRFLTQKRNPGSDQGRREPSGAPRIVKCQLVSICVQNFISLSQIKVGQINVSKFND
jgi:hypothetical protein